jgi:hypothetical protein
MPILITLMMEAMCSPEKAVFTRVTRRHIQNGILHSPRRESLKSSECLWQWHICNYKIISEIRGFHGCGYKECRLLECDSVWLL